MNKEIKEFKISEEQRRAIVEIRDKIFNKYGRAIELFHNATPLQLQNEYNCPIVDDFNDDIIKWHARNREINPRKKMCDDFYIYYTEWKKEKEDRK